jgi:S-adenosylmethionine synthetase
MLRGHAGRESNANMALKNGCLERTQRRTRTRQQLQTGFACDSTFVSTHLPAMVMYATQMPKTVANTKKSTTMIIQG